MWADTETGVDFLNYSEVAELIAEMIAKPALLPLSLGVFGSWGVGKSSTLRLVEAELSKEPEKYLVIKFDAWLYQDFDEARAALMSVIAAELIKASPPTVIDKAKGLFKRINKLRTLGLLLEGGALAMGVPTFGLITRGLQGVQDVVTGGGDKDDLEAIKTGAEEAKSKAKGLFHPAPEEHGPPEEIEAFRKEFGEVLSGLDRTMVVFIDNLDRCLPENTIHTLEAVRLFLFMPKTAFVIGADEDMIRHAVAQHFKEPGERQVADYLDKLIQIPVRVPRAGIHEVRAYLFLLLVFDAVSDESEGEKLRKVLIERLQKSWMGEAPIDIPAVLKTIGKDGDDALRHSLETADRMAPMLAKSTRVLGNPRIIKRLLNVVRMRASIAKKRKMPLDEALIAKIALFERCTDVAATEAFHDLINSSPKGKLAVLGTFEQGTAQDDDKKKLPTAWENHMSFILEWAELEPQLADVDLRPAVYLSRETVPLRIASSTLPAAVTRAVGELMNTVSLSSKAATQAISALSGDQLTMAMDQLVLEMRKETDLSKVRADFRGATLLARSSPDAAKIFLRFLRTLGNRPPWLAAMLRTEAWLKE